MKNIFLILCSALILCSCSDWLDVEPKTNIDEKDLFDKEQGFKEALTGIYIKMCSTSLYGRELTYGFMDIIAQRYENSQNQSANYSDASVWYTYPSTKTQTYTDAIWTESYNIIANLNNLLSNIEKNGAVITTEGYHDIIKGEALGLRGFLYFDLLRMFGPIYKDNPQSPSIPYRTEFNRDVAKLLPASEVVEKILSDLLEAEKLLENDPMSISFPTSGGGTGFLDNRFNRMNKYAVKAELARVYLYKGDKASAAQKAAEVINATKTGSSERQFTLITDNAQDKLGSTELIFALNMDSETFPDQVSDELAVTSWSMYSVSTKRLNSIFDITVDGTNDMRYKEGCGFLVSTDGAVTLKYSQDNLPSPVLKCTVPLVKLPEMYYILAECEDDLSAAAADLSTVRSSRGVDDIMLSTENDRREQLEKEYRKEFYAEGQLWYFYKRCGYETFLNCPVEHLTESNYRFPIPDDETSLGNIN